MASAQQPRKGRDAGVAVLDDLKASSHSLAPRHFEFWFNYRTGKHPPLNAAADEIVAARGKLADRDIDQLYDRFLSPWRFGEDCNALTRRFADRLEDVSSALDEAIGSSLAQREILVAESCDLSLGGTVTLQRVIEAVDRLMQSTKDGQMRHAILEARLEAASRQIGALRRQLDAVRGESRSDPLTSLENRTAFEAALDRAATHAARSSGIRAASVPTATAPKPHGSRRAVRARSTAGRSTVAATARGRKSRRTSSPMCSSTKARG